ncbi:putative antitoxin YezG [compost metagenome]
MDILDIFSLDNRKHKELKHQLYEYFEELWKEFKVQEQEQWTSLTYLLDSSGKIKINYGYEDISLLSPVEKQEKWEAEYLR